MPTSRRTYDESIAHLQGAQVIAADESPPIPERTPQPEDDEPLGLSFFRTRLTHGNRVDLSNLTLPRTFFGRSEIRNASFRNTDLSESNLRWNDFIDLDLSDSSLVGADLRASLYVRVVFANADLRGADLRYATFEGCSFEGANMQGSILAEDQRSAAPFSAVQIRSIDWRKDHGPEPSGG